MNLTSIRYFVVLAKKLHFTKAAQDLYITQQNLSQHIKKLEDHYGAALFHRKPQLQLTPAGRVFFEACQKIVNEEDNVVHHLNDMAENNVGVLYVGVTQYRGQYWLPRVLPDYMRAWPNVTVSIVNKTSVKMEQMLFSGDLDFFVGIKYENDPLLKAIPLMNDKVYLALTRDLLLRYFGDETEQIIEESKNGTSLKKFKDMPFLRLTSNFRLRKLMDLCFEEAGFRPKTALEASSIELMISLFQENLGAFFCTGMRVPSLKAAYPDSVFLPLLLQQEYIFSPLSIVYHKDRFFPGYAKDFMTRVQELFSSIEVDS